MLIIELKIDGTRQNLERYIVETVAEVKHIFSLCVETSRVAR